MPSLILQTASRMLHPLLIIFSLFLLIRGHNEPGGGFVGGLIAAAAFALYAIAYDVAYARRALRVSPILLIGLGLSAATAAGTWSLFVGDAYMTGQIYVLPWQDIEITSPLVFDIGVYLVVLGVSMAIILNLGEE